MAQKTRKRNVGAAIKPGFAEEKLEISGVGGKNLTTFLTYFTEEGSLHKLFEGKDIDKEANLLLKQALRLAYRESLKLSMHRFQRKDLRAAIRKFIADTRNLYKVLIAVEADTGLDVGKFSGYIEQAIQRSANSIISFLEDYGELQDIEYIRNSVADIFEGIASTTAIEKNKVISDALAQEIREKKYDEHLASYMSYFTTDDFPGSLTKYVILNYRKSAMLEVFASLILFSRMEDKPIEDTTAYLANEELFLMPMLSPYKESMLFYLQSLQKPAHRVEPSINNVVEGLKFYKDVPYRNVWWITEQISFQSLRERLLSNAFTNKSALQSLDKRDVPKDILSQFIIKEMKEKKVSIMPDVVPANSEFPARTVDFYINDWIEGQPIRKIMSYWDSIITFTDGTQGGQFAVASTDGNYIYLLPYLNLFNTRHLNNFQYFRHMAHEKNHIQLGTFKVNLSWQPSIDLLAHKGKFPKLYRGKEKSLKLVSELLNTSLEEAIKNMAKRIKTKTATMLELQQEFQSIFLSKAEPHKDDKYVKKMINALSNQNGLLFLQILNNIVEDYRIDNTFIKLDSDEGLDYGSNRDKLRELQALYRFGQYVLLFTSAKDYRRAFEMAASTFEQKEKKVDSTNLLLYMTKLGPALFRDVFEDFSYENIFAQEIERLTNNLVRFDKNGNVIRENFSNESFAAALEYMAMMAFFEEEVPEMPPMKGGKGKKMPGPANPFQEPQAQQGQGQAQQGEEQEGQGAGQGEEEEEQEGLPKSLTDAIRKGKAKLGEEVPKQNIAPTKGEGKERIKIPPQQSRTISIPRSLVLKYKNALSNLYEGSIKKETIFGKKGTNAEPKRLVKFIYEGGAGKPDFLMKTKTEFLREGSELEQRPITIYVGIDTSGSMEGYREDLSLTHALALFAAFDELKEIMRDANIKLKLFSTATMDKNIVLEYDASSFTYESSKNTVTVSFSFEPLGGGTDLVGMVEAFESTIKEVEKETNEMIFRNKAALNPSILILYFTDFGDNSGDAVGVSNAIASFAEFIEKYRSDSHLVKGGMSDVGVSMIYAAPEVDDFSVKDAVEKRLDEGVVVLSKGEEDDSLVKAIKQSIPVLMGFKASNIKTE
ncbi:MAG: hypothetical protein D6769_02195 [Methanobacteriota archaeon]|nr:MAG: hypothetical protein D6769_02195 [Euryarchaeota archaeon]